MEKEKLVLDGVIGHNEEQKELLLILKWFTHVEEYNKLGIQVPKGILLYGEPGNGKSYMIRQLVKQSNCPCFIFNFKGENLIHEINKLFNDAKKNNKSIVVIDELDLLIENNRQLIRCLQEHLDGIENENNILFIGACNEIRKIPAPLLRQGRIDRQIYIPYLKEEKLYECFQYYADKIGLKLENDVDKTAISKVLHHISCAGIKAIVNDIALRSKDNVVTRKNIYDSIYFIANKITDFNKESELYISYHEAGHAVMMNHYKKYFTLTSLSLYSLSGSCQGYQANYKYETYEIMLAKIAIAYAGPMTSKIIFKTGDEGCVSDLEKARKYAYYLINKCGYHGFYKTLPNIGNTTREETFIKRRNNERLIEKLLIKIEKQTYKFIKSHVNEITRLAKLLNEKKFLTEKEVYSCLID